MANSKALEALPVVRTASPVAILTAIEYNAIYSTEIHLANATNLTNRFAIVLQNPDGTSAGVYAGQLAPKGKFVSRVEEIFPSLPNPFTGYAVVQGDGSIVAAELVTSGTAMAALNAQTLDLAASGSGKLYAPHFASDASTFTNLNLVNVTNQEASLVVRAFGDDGKALGQPVSIKLTPGQQYWKEVSQVFGFDTQTGASGSLAIESSVSNILGDISFGDRSVRNRYRSSLPLGSSLKSGLIGYVGNDGGTLTSVVIANPNSVLANAQIKLFRSDGSLTGSANLRVPINARVSNGLTQLIAAAAGQVGGYLTIDSDQPVMAFAVIAVAAGTDCAVIPAEPAPGTGTASSAAGPVIAVTPATLDFGVVNTGATKDLTFTVANNGTAALTVTSATSSNPRFTVASPALPFNVAPSGQQVVTVRFAPTAAGAQTGTLAIATNDPANASINVSLSGTGVGSNAPSIEVTPASLDFGSVNVGQSRDLNLTIGNKGSAALALSSIASDNPRFAASIVAITLPAGGSLTLPVRFTPVAAGAQTGTLTVASNDPVTAALKITVRGTGVGAAAASEMVLRVDGGSFSGSIGYDEAVENAVFVNRLTPPSYPATIKNVQIYFGNRADGLRLNTPITVVSATNPSGSATISALTAGVIDAAAATVTSFGQFITYPVPARTITSGDFVVGFVLSNPPGVYPADLDKTPPSQGRSYVSTDGVSFRLVDTFGASTTGNFGIRATVTSGGTSAP